MLYLIQGLEEGLKAMSSAHYFSSTCGTVLKYKEMRIVTTRTRPESPTVAKDWFYNVLIRKYIKEVSAEYTDGRTD